MSYTSYQLINTFHKREKVAKREKYCYYCVNFFQDDTVVLLTSIHL